MPSGRDLDRSLRSPAISIVSTSSPFARSKREIDGAEDVTFADAIRSHEQIQSGSRFNAKWRDVIVPC